jgi:hypothetical protein
MQHRVAVLGSGTMEENPALVVGAISGPNITQDIMAHRPTGIVVASESNAARARAGELIELPSLRSFGLVRPPRRRVPGRAQERRRHRRRAGLGDNARSFLIILGLKEIQGLVLRLRARDHLHRPRRFWRSVPVVDRRLFPGGDRGRPRTCLARNRRGEQWRSQGGVREEAVAVPGAEMAAPAPTIHVSPMNQSVRRRLRRN